MAAFCSWGQTRTDSLSVPTQQLELRHDNDFLLTTDQYYSSGLFLTYRRRLSKSIFPKMESQLELGLTQQVYTPSDTQSEDPADYDRSYAAYSGFSLNFSLANTKSLYKGSIEVGQAGPRSGAGGFQRWYHNTIVISPPPAWVAEIDNGFHINGYFSLIKEWEWEPNPFGIRVAPAVHTAAGTKDLYLEPEIAMHFGRRNPMHQSIAYNQLGSIQREIYFSLRASYRFVFYNALIEGYPGGDNSPLLFEPEKRVLRIGFDLRHRFNKSDYTLGYRYLGPEVPGNNGHNYLILSYALSFGS